MKNRLLIIIAFLAVAAVRSSAQNIPDGSSPSGSATDIYPLDYSNLYGYYTFSTPDLYNYTRIYIPFRPVQYIPVFDSTKGLPIYVTTTYTDGLCNPLEIIQRNNSGKDIITPIDNRHGLTSYQFLPYADSFHRRFDTIMFAKQKAYYSSLYPSEDITAYSASVASTTKGRQVIATYSPGVSFVGSQKGTNAMQYYNKSGEIPVIELNPSTHAICSTGYYAANVLVGHESTGQHGLKTVSYTNKNNQVVCKKVYAGGDAGNSGWLVTYYLYNELGRLLYIIPPKAFEQFNSNTCLSNINKLCFSYEYDDMGQPIKKQTPARDSLDYYVYDKKHHMVMSQSGILRQSNQWTFSIFDDNSRVVVSGIYTGSGVTEQGYWQDIANGGGSPLSYTVNGHSASPRQTLEYWLAHWVTGYTDYPDTLANCRIDLLNYYDSYDSIPISASFNTVYASDYLPATDGIQTPTPYMFTDGKLLETRTRIIDNGLPNNFANTPWITSVFFYDEKSKLIQAQTLNPWNTSDWDISNMQYNFAGQKVLDMTKHYYLGGSNKPSTKIMTKYVYETTSGRLGQVEEKIGQGSWTTLSVLEYDDFGRVKKKWLGNVEQQNYTYNIRGQLTGINADKLFTYDAIADSTISYLEEVDYDAGFSIPRYDGNISGYQWRTRSSRVRAYGYDYDTAGRMITADFTEDTGNVWTNAYQDYSVSNIKFDANGNMLTMNQRGPGANYSSMIYIDSLTYNYDAGNRLTAIIDSATTASLLDDFDNGSTGTGTDYSYDADGNLASDANKGIGSIKYNYQDLPLEVVKAHDSIRNIYDATGTLIQKRIHEGSVVTIYSYWGPFVYKNDTLQYILNSEGRTRWLADSSFFKNDYFVKDHLDNVRTVITADVRPGPDMSAGFELRRANIEEDMFAHVGEIRDYSPDGAPDDLYAGYLDGSDSAKRIGAAVLLHAMAGDQLSLTGYGYYQDMDTSAMNIYATPEDMLSSLLGALASGTGLSGEAEGLPGTITGTTINNLLSTDNYAIYDDMVSNITDRNFPRTYLNYLVFDESMNLLPAKCQIVQLKGPADTWNQMDLSGNVTVDASGYILVYFSNSTDGAAWINNISISTIKGRLVQEQHYYPHGLLIDGVQDASVVANKYKYQGKLMQDELGMQLYDFHARQYDPQIGRFWGIDPADQFPSGYTGMANDPANSVDPSGMFTLSINRLGSTMEGYTSLMQQRRDAIEQKERFENGFVSQPPLVINEYSESDIENLEAHNQARFELFCSIVDAEKKKPDLTKNQVAKTTIGGAEVDGSAKEMEKTQNQETKNVAEDQEKKNEVDKSPDPGASNNIDKDNIIIANDKEGASGYGHTGTVIGNDDPGHGWTYISKQGRAEGGESSTNNAVSGGPAKDVDLRHFATKADFMNSTDVDIARYDRFIEIPVSHSEAETAKGQILHEANSKYNVIFDNCGQAVDRGLDKIGIQTAPFITPNSNFNYIKQHLPLNSSYYER